MIDFIAHHAGVIGLLFFFTFFTVVTMWIYRPGARDSYEVLARIPLSEDNHD